MLIERGVTSPVLVVPTGVTVERFAHGNGRELRMRRQIPEDAFVVGHMGRLAPEKNLAFLAGSVAAAFGTEGEVTIPTPDPITRRYRFDLREPALVPGSDGIEFLAGAETVWVDGPPR